MPEKSDLKQVNKYTWEVLQSFRGDMKVPGRIFASDKIIDLILEDKSIDQTVNVACLPGIQNASLAMPDVHQGYGMPVGGVAAFDLDEGIISPGAVGYDINCGVRVIRTGVSFSEIEGRIPKLTKKLFENVPSGVGQGGHLKLQRRDLDDLLEHGVEWMVKKNYATEDDLKHCESEGKLEEADARAVSKKAKDRGKDQVGTLGAGNHFLEIQRIDKILDEKAAEVMEIEKDEVVIMIHCGSRGFGHQVATDYIETMNRNLHKYDFDLPDKQLACSPFKSDEGQDYWKAMCAGANFAWANRQFITHLVRKAWANMFDEGLEEARENLKLIYDVAHNIAKVENHETDSSDKKVVVHRKGATRSFPKNHPETPKSYKNIGQPVLIPGSMGTASFILAGEEGSMKKSFGSSCHGAGRVMSRTQAKKEVWGGDLKERLESRGISVEAGSMAGLAEEAPTAYKDVVEVVKVVEGLNLARRVARMRPVGVIKG